MVPPHSKMKPRPASCQILYQFADVIGTMWHRPPVADFAATFAFCHRHRNRRLMDIQPYERAILHLVSPPFLRLGASQPGATLERRMPWERPLNQSAHSAIMGSNRLASQGESFSPFAHQSLRTASVVVLRKLHVRIPLVFGGMTEFNRAFRLS